MKWCYDADGNATWVPWYIDADLLQGYPISTDAPSVGDVLTWDGSEWTPQVGGGGGSSVYTADVAFTTPARFLTTDVAVASATTSQNVIASMSPVMPAPYDADELEMDPLTVCGYVPTDGTVRLYVSVTDQRSAVVGTRSVCFSLGQMPS